MTIKFKILFFFILICSIGNSQYNKQYAREINALKYIVQSFRELIIQSENKILLEKLPVFESNTEKFKFEFVDIDDGSNEIFKGTIAIALGSSDDNKIHIIIDFENWNKLNVVEKFATIMHEISHDAFNFKHSDNDELSLMHPFSQPKSITELTQMTLRMLENSKYGLLEEFTPNEIYIHSNSINSKTLIYNKSFTFGL